MKVGFIGIGAMGKPMSSHIIEAGYDLIVSDIKKEAARDILSKGAKWADTPQTIAECCEVVITSLPLPKDVEDVVYGKHGLMAGWKKGNIFVDMSTNSPSVIRKIAKDALIRGVEVLDAPVSGGAIGADSRRLSIIVGGKMEVLGKIRKILEVLATRYFTLGMSAVGIR